MKIVGASICDSLGNLLYISQGARAYDAHFQVMANGTGLSNRDDGYGARLHQGALSFPVPNSTQLYYLFTIDDTLSSAIGSNLYVHTIDMTKNNGLGEVINKKQLLIEDSLTWGGLTATKHANGRDWWVLIFKENKAEYYSILVSPDGFMIKKGFTETAFNTTGKYIFTPDGQKYIMFDHATFFPPAVLRVFDFDRCSGHFSNEQSHLLLDSNMIWVGLAASQDSRYLYVNYDKLCYQYDLTATDIFATETLVAEWDGTLYAGLVPTNFGPAQLAPDGRIYINTTNGNNYLHRIEFPHRAGLACDFQQNKIWTTITAFEMPNHPNYRLGPIDGSLCDTLGLDNHPLAHWRWDIEDTLAPYTYTFTDLSYYEPSTWRWDFGDGSTSTGKYTSHAYTTAGVYQACLEVCNVYSCDTLCKEIVVGVSGVEEENLRETEQRFELFPNPFDKTLNINRLDASQGETYTVQLFNVTGLLVFEQKSSEITRIEAIQVGFLPAGLYFYAIKNESGVVLQTGKVVKQGQ